MTTSSDTTTAQPAVVPSRRHKRWIWMLVFGICLLIQGTVSLVDSVAAEVASMLLVGWMLIAAGIIGGILAIRHRAHGHLSLYLLGAILAILVGVVLLRNPAVVARVFALLVAVYFVVLGAFHIAMAFKLRDPGWGWMLFAGIAVLILGILTWTRWPISGPWALGFFIGINLIVIGWSQVMMALALRSVQAVDSKTSWFRKQLRSHRSAEADTRSTASRESG